MLGNAGVDAFWRYLTCPAPARSLFPPRFMGLFHAHHRNRWEWHLFHFLKVLHHRGVRKIFSVYPFLTSKYTVLALSWQFVNSMTEGVDLSV